MGNEEEGRGKRERVGEEKEGGERGNNISHGMLHAEFWRCDLRRYNFGGQGQKLLGSDILYST